MSLTLTQSVDVDFDLDVACDECGDDLNADVRETTSRSNKILMVAACEKCFERAKKEAAADAVEEYIASLDAANDAMAALSGRSGGGR